MVKEMFSRHSLSLQGDSLFHVASWDFVDRMVAKRKRTIHEIARSLAKQINTWSAAAIPVI